MGKEELGEVMITTPVELTQIRQRGNTTFSLKEPRSVQEGRIMNKETSFLIPVEEKNGCWGVGFGCQLGGMHSLKGKKMSELKRKISRSKGERGGKSLPSLFA